MAAMVVQAPEPYSRVGNIMGLYTFILVFGVIVSFIKHPVSEAALADFFFLLF